MGFNTTILILNDHLGDIKDDPTFGDKIYEAAAKVFSGKGIHIDHGALVIESHHADHLKLLLVGGNSAYDLGYVGGYALDPSKTEDMKIILSSVAERYGLRVSKIPKKR